MTSLKIHFWSRCHIFLSVLTFTYIYWNVSLVLRTLVNRMTIPKHTVGYVPMKNKGNEILRLYILLRAFHTFLDSILITRLISARIQYYTSIVVYQCCVGIASPSMFRKDINLSKSLHMSKGTFLHKIKLKSCSKISAKNSNMKTAPLLLFLCLQALVILAKVEKNLKNSYLW